jgi:hypothetical protein
MYLASIITIIPSKVLSNQTVILSCTRTECKCTHTQKKISAELVQILDIVLSSLQLSYDSVFKLKKLADDLICYK